jgi:hypothetical protein
MPPGGVGVLATACEQCIEPCEDGLVVLDGVRVCGRRHFYARLAPGHYGVTPQPLTMG